MGIERHWAETLHSQELLQVLGQAVRPGRSEWARASGRRREMCVFERMFLTVGVGGLL